MLRLDVKRMLELRGESRGYEYLRGLGFGKGQVRAMMSKRGLRQVPMRTLKKLCVAFCCLPDELFAWHGDGGHELARLNLMSPKALWERLNALTDDEIKALLQERSEEGKGADGGDGHLYLNVQRLMAERGMKPGWTELQKMGFSKRESYCLLNIVYLRLPLDLLTRLCVAFGCGPNELLSWSGGKDHVLGPLKRESRAGRMAMLRQVPLNRLFGG